MLKNVLKFSVIVLLLLCILSVPLFGFSLYDSPSIFKENAIFTNRQFGGGTAVNLDFPEDQKENITDEDYETASKILKERFLAMGYSDVETAVVDENVRVIVSQKTYIDSLVSQASAPGSWSFVGSNLSDVVCDGSMVEDAYVAANNVSGGYSVVLKFTEEGAKKFASNVSSYAASSSYIYFMVDDQFANYASVSSGSVTDTFSFGSLDQSTASIYATYIKYGELPASMIIKSTEASPATFGSTLIMILAIVSAAIVLLCALLLLIKAGKFGILGIFVILGDIAVLATGLVNGAFMLNLATLIASLILVVLSTVTLIPALAPFKNDISALTLKKLSKQAVRLTWLHAILLTVAIACLFFVTGPAIYVVRCTSLFVCANYALFFAFVYFGIHTANDSKKA